jgi:hypothetical protein
MREMAMDGYRTAIKTLLPKLKIREDATPESLRDQLAVAQAAVGRSTQTVVPPANVAQPVEKRGLVPPPANVQHPAWVKKELK